MNEVAAAAKVILAATTPAEARILLGSLDGPLPAKVLQHLLTEAAGSTAGAREASLHAAERLCESADDSEASAALWTQMGLWCGRAGLYDRSLLAFERAAAQYHRLNDRAREADVLSNAAQSALQCEQHDRAKRHISEALQEHRRCGAKDRVWNDLQVLAQLEIRARNVERATELLREAVAAAEESRMFAGLMSIATGARRLVQAGANRGDVDSLYRLIHDACRRIVLRSWPALETEQDRVAFLERNAGPLLQESFAFGFILESADDLVATMSVPDLETLLAVGRQLVTMTGSPKLAAALQVVTAELRSLQNDREAVVRAVRRVIVASHEVGSAEERLALLRRVAVASEHVGAYQACMDSFDAASELITDESLAAERAEILMAKGVALKNLGDPRAAILIFRDLVNRVETGSRIAARVQVNLGNALEIVGERQEACECYRRAQRLGKDAGDVDAQVSALIGIGIAKKNLGDFHASQKAYQDAMRLCKSNGLEAAMATVGENLRVLKQERGGGPPSEPATDDSDAIVRRGGLLMEKALVAWQRRNLDRAAKMLEESVALFRQLDVPSSLAAALLNLAALSRDRGNLDAALAQAEEALAIAERTRIADHEMRAHEMLAFALVDKGHDLVRKRALERPGKRITQAPGADRSLQSPGVGALIRQFPELAEISRSHASEALKHMRAALGVAERLKGEAATEKERMAFGEKVQRVYETAIVFAIETGDDDAILELMEKSRARTFLDSLEEVAHQRMVGSSLGPSGGATRSLSEGHSIDLRQLRQVWDEQVFGGQEPDKSTLIILYHVLSDTSFYVLAIDPLVKDGVEFLHRSSLLGSGDPARHEGLVPHLVDDFRQALDDSIELMESALDDAVPVTGQDWDEQKESVSAELREAEERVRTVLGQLYAALLTPVEHRMAEYERVLIVPHRKLHHVPFHALLDANGLALMDKGIDVFYAPSLTSLKYTYAHRGPARFNQILAIGDPESDLADASQECRELCRLYGQSEDAAFLGARATLGAYEQMAPQAEVLHIATHGEFVENSPAQSYLLFADGGLDAHRIEGVPLRNANLVVLSACFSGRSKVSNSDELIGMLRGFYLAGAPTVVASLWPVYSVAAAHLMRSFHTRLAHRTTPDVASAMRAAMIEARLLYPLTAQWAPFCVYGRHGWNIG